MTLRQALHHDGTDAQQGTYTMSTAGFYLPQLKLSLRCPSVRLVFLVLPFRHR